MDEEKNKDFEKELEELRKMAEEIKEYTKEEGNKDGKDPENS